MQCMDKLKKTKQVDYWMVRIPGFPSDKREALHRLSSKERMSTSAYIGNLLEREIEKHKEQAYDQP